MSAATIKGELGTFAVGPERKFPYFLSGDPASTRVVVFIGGLFNGLGDVPYLPRLSDALGGAGWRLAQLHWTSAYDAFAISSLDTDVAELSLLVAHLRVHHGAARVVLMGHSTGSQDVIHYLTASAAGKATVAPVDGGIMQAPVSDREHFGADPALAAWAAALPRARQLVAEGRGQEVLEGDLGLRMSAYRLWSLLDDSGEDDYFSGDLPLHPDGVHAHPLASSFGALAAPALALFSEQDEFHHIADVPAHLARWVAAAGGEQKLRAVIVPGADHAVHDAEAQEVLVQAAVKWLQDVIV